MLVEPAQPLLTEPISHSSTGLNPPPLPKNKIKRDLSSSCHSSSLLHQQQQLSWAGGCAPALIARRAWAGSPRAHLLGLGFPCSQQPPPCSYPPSSPRLLCHFQPRNILNRFTLKLQKQSVSTFLQFPALYLHLSFVRVFIQQVV